VHLTLEVLILVHLTLKVLSLVHLTLQIVILVHLTLEVVILVHLALEPCLISNLMHKILIYLHIIHLLKSSTCFEHYPAHPQEAQVAIVYMQPLVSSLSAGDCLVHRLRKNWLRKNRCTRQSSAESEDTRGCIYINCDVDLLRMSRVVLETCRGF